MSVGLAALLLCLPGGSFQPDAAGGFTLEWTHSVERIAWREAWRVTPDGLSLTGAAVKGSGAGMEAGPGAELRDGWWHWTPPPLTVPELVLAASGATQSGWQLCAEGRCVEIGASAEAPLILRPCPGPGG